MTLDCFGTFCLLRNCLHLPFPPSPWSHYHQSFELSNLPFTSGHQLPRLWLLPWWLFQLPVLYKDPCWAFHKHGPALQVLAFTWRPDRSWNLHCLFSEISKSLNTWPHYGLALILPLMINVCDSLWCHTKSLRVQVWPDANEGFSNCRNICSQRSMGSEKYEV